MIDIFKEMSSKSAIPPSAKTRSFLVLGLAINWSHLAVLQGFKSNSRDHKAWMAAALQRQEKIEVEGIDDDKTFLIQICEC